MKNIVLLFCIPLLLSACGNDFYEQQYALYESAVEKVNNKELSGCDETLALLFETEMGVARLSSSVSSRERKELRGDYGAEFSAMENRIESMRDSLFFFADKAYDGAHFHFVEKRIILYGCVADCYSKVQTNEELEVVQSLYERYSAMAYADGQRLCDSPQRSRQLYDSLKNVVSENYNAALGRLGK
jgi:hypothetical protein